MMKPELKEAEEYLKAEFALDQARRAFSAAKTDLFEAQKRADRALKAYNKRRNISFAATYDAHGNRLAD